MIPLPLQPPRKIPMPAHTHNLAFFITLKGECFAQLFIIADQTEGVAFDMFEKDEEIDSFHGN